MNKSIKRFLEQPIAAKIFQALRNMQIEAIEKNKEGFFISKIKLAESLQIHRNSVTNNINKMQQLGIIYKKSGCYCIAPEFIESEYDEGAELPTIVLHGLANNHYATRILRDLIRLHNAALVEDDKEFNINLFRWSEDTGIGRPTLRKYLNELSEIGILNKNLSTCSLNLSVIQRLFPSMYHLISKTQDMDNKEKEAACTANTSPLPKKLISNLTLKSGNKTDCATSESPCLIQIEAKDLREATYIMDILNKLYLWENQPIIKN